MLPNREHPSCWGGSGTGLKFAFSVMVRSLGLHRIEARSFWGLAARVNLILLVHNLFRSRVLLRMAGVEL